MYKILFVLVCAVQIHSQSLPGEAWVSRARVVHPLQFFSNVMQEFSYELERREWCNLKLTDISQNVSVFIANWNVTGTVLYSKGFVISIQKIDVSSVTSHVTRVIEDEVNVIPSASVSGRLHFRHMNIGYDVLADLDELGELRYTGEILNNNVAFDFMITKNMINETITTTAGLAVLEGANIRMIFSPANHITEVLSRNIASGNNWNGLLVWREPFEEILKDIVINKVEFPRVCFNDC